MHRKLRLGIGKWRTFRERGKKQPSRSRPNCSIEAAAQAATQIAASTHQQTNGMEQLATAMAAIKQATAQTAASTRQAEHSAQDLNGMARQMEQAVARYQL